MAQTTRLASFGPVYAAEALTNALHGLDMQ
jgi:hypothetical protein